MTHTFTLSGLGEAPFSIAHPKLHATEKGLGEVFWCEHCGTTIKNRNFIKSADGKISVVGIDCLRKTGDEGLIAGAKRLAREIKAEKKESARMAALEESRQAQREKNGGKTDEEIRQEKKEAIEAAIKEKREKYIAEASEHPVCKSLTKMGFEMDMQHHFYLLRPFSAGQLAAIKRIYAKKLSGARKNSKAYKAVMPDASLAVDEAQAMLEKHHAEIEAMESEIQELTHCL